MARHDQAPEPVLLSRNLILKTGEEERSATILVFQPKAVAKKQATCSVWLKGIKSSPFTVYGLDEMQAVYLAIGYAERELEALAPATEWSLQDQP
jgi:hypothetical protein